jgi:hypothetical protein
MITRKQLRKASPNTAFIMLPKRKFKNFTERDIFAEGILLDTIEKKLDYGFIQPELKVPAVFYDKFLVVEARHEI